MKVTLVLIGKTDKPLFARGVEEYAGRIARYCKLEVRVIPELRGARSMPVEVQLQKEADAILPLIRGGQEVVLLDERGQEFSSVGFARFVERRMVAGQRELLFVVGGPYGFADRVRDAAHAQMSLSRLTYSHQLVRLVFLEQLYRAFTIIKGEPYHHP